MSTAATVTAWTVPAWSAFRDLRHGFFGRRGGVSTGRFASLNCSAQVGDAAAAVGENRRRVSRVLGVEPLRVSLQVHGARVVELARGGDPGEADALVAGCGDGMAGILTADCVPLLLVVPESRLAGAVHAGWRGTALGIAGAVVERLVALAGRPASALHAALGPSIGACCYEVGPEVIDAMGAFAPRVVRTAAGKGRIDLRAINAALLRESGVPASQIHQIGPCTRCATDEFFSHRGEPGGTGRQLSAVGWAPSTGDLSS